MEEYNLFLFSLMNLSAFSRMSLMQEEIPETTIRQTCGPHAVHFYNFIISRLLPSLPKLKDLFIIHQLTCQIFNLTINS